MITNMEDLKNLLKAKGLKPTYQRLKIFEFLNNHKDNHPTVETIYGSLSKRIPTISMTTVYNTLNAFIQKNLVSAVTITGTEVRYDFITSHHHHFLCKKCGRIIDIDVKCPLGEKSDIDGHKIEELHGYLKGICKFCLKKKKDEDKHQINY